MKQSQANLRPNVIFGLWGSLVLSWPTGVLHMLNLVYQRFVSCVPSKPIHHQHSMFMMRESSKNPMISLTMTTVTMTTFLIRHHQLLHDLPHPHISRSTNPNGHLLFMIFWPIVWSKIQTLVLMQFKCWFIHLFLLTRRWTILRFSNL